MAVDTSHITALFTTISDALKSSATAFPEDASSLLPPTDGISLLDVKNDLLLSYLQHLVFLILIRLQNASRPVSNHENLDKKVVSKLIELRAYLDRGCRPLEGKLRYQIDKVLRAAEDADRSAAQKTQTNGVAKKKKSGKKRPATTNNDSDISISGSDIDSADSDALTNASDDDEDLHTAPRLSLLASSASQKANANSANASTKKSLSRDNIYRAPKINPTSMPTSKSSDNNAEDTRSSRRRKHALLDEYITEETSSAPTAQPSIGSNNTITSHGRNHSTLNSRSRDNERERTAYEEANFTRLPAVSKADRKKEKARQAREGRDMFGGEDWTGLGGLGDRIERSVSGRGVGGRGNVLERREKRKRETGDLPRGDGVGIGHSFEKRRRILQGRERKKGRR